MTEKAPKQKNARLIWQKPKHMKQYGFYAALTHGVLLVFIILFIFHNYHHHQKINIIDAAIISSIPHAQTKTSTQAVDIKQSKQKPIIHNWHQQLQLEQQQLNQQQKHVDQQARMREIDQLREEILQRIASYWQIPKAAKPNMQCVVQIQLSNVGVVQSIQLVKSSGLASLDQSAIDAVKKASPLPMPNDLNLINTFKQLRLTLRPEKIVHV